MIGVLPYLALTMGLMSSFHCIGMCGPVALALPIQRGNRLQQFAGLLLYNSGRAITYAILGLVVGFFGSSIAFLGYLRYLSIFSGTLMLGYVFCPSKFNLFLHPPKVWQLAVKRIKENMSTMLRSRRMYGWFMLGTLNGLLPCGLVYLALVSSVATGSSVSGGFYMLLFGLGTMPAMMAVGFFRNWFTPVLRTRLHRVVPFFIAFAGIWLVVRGVLIQYPASKTTPSGTITICHGE